MTIWTITFENRAFRMYDTVAKTKEDAEQTLQNIVRDSSFGMLRLDVNLDTFQSYNVIYYYDDNTTAKTDVSVTMHVL